ncbi:RHS repeat-associated core domain-containing protein [Streptomyces sp. V1I1]|uniref:RHS repeat-associated core domain-containing protein n=2 Tax=Streptomyces sp. V1I1 TaxID=3042272 RepID=UPI002783ACE5|nr:RHS repeat-associated core domain-containing protein [Streptomyces sp. V1I1]MDQ0946064.1 RHS repeat-associated protein [Streptomyces sp. V1I1]
MGYTIPEGVDTMLDVVGVGWPNVDEDAYRDMADALREFADDADDDGHAAHQYVQRLLSSGQSESLTALDKHWSKVQGKHKDLAKAARIIAGALDRVADIIVARKIAAVGELADLCATVGITLAFAPVTAGLSTLLAGAKIAATRIAFKRILKEMAEAAVSEIVATLTQPAVAAIENVVADLAIQTAMNVAGVQDGYNTDQTVQAGKDGLQLNSADGPGGQGPGAGPVIDHDAHGKAGMHLANVQISMRNKTGGKLGKAKGHHGRAKGKDSLTAVLDTTIEGVTEKLGKALNDLGDHVGKTLPNAITKGSKTHKDTDHDVRDRVKNIKSDDRKDEGDLKGRRGRSGDERRRRPESMQKTQESPREKGVSLAKRRCETDPVDVASGEMVLPQTDLILPGVLPLVLRRTHVSGYRYGHCFGASWASTLDERLELLGAGAAWAREDGSVLVYPMLPAAEGEDVWPLEGDRLPLTYVESSALGDTTYAVADPRSGLTRRFTGSPYRAGGLYWLKEIEDRNGNSVQFGRNDEGLPATVVHDGGYRLRVDINPELGRVTGLALHTPDGPVQIVSFGYDSDRNLDAVTNSSGLPLRFTYDQDGRVTSWTDRKDSTYHYTYDSTGRVTRTTGPDGFLSSAFTYDVHSEPGHRVTRYTDSTGATTLFHVNQALQIVAETDPLGHTTHFEFDAYDQVLAQTDALGHTTRFERDTDGSLVGLVAPDGVRTTAVYNQLRQPVTVTERGGIQRQYAYDDQGNRTMVIEPSGARTEYEFNHRGHVIAVRNAVGDVTRITTDAAGLPLRITAPDGASTVCSRDAFGRATTVTDAVGGTLRQGWTTEGKPAWRELPDGTREEWTWDGEGNLTSHTDRMGRTSTYTATHFDQPATTHTGGGAYRFTHDTELRLTKVTNAQGLEWEYTYDAAGRLISETDFDGRTLTYEHDALGRLVRRTNAAGQTLMFERDILGRVTRLHHDDGSVSTFSRGETGHVSQITNAHARIDLERDAAGRVVAETANGRTLTLAYDALGRRTHRRTPSGASSDLAYTWEGLATYAAGDHSFSFSRDALGRETARTLQDTITLRQEWDAVGRCVHQSLSTPHDTVLERAFAYQADGSPLSVDDSHTGRRTYTVDAASRITTVHARGWTEQYAYNTAGDQTHTALPPRAPGQDNTGERGYHGTRITRAGRTRYRYDAQGRLTLRQTNTLSGKTLTWRFTWDAEDRLTHAETPTGRWRYLYDALGRRLAKQRLDTDGQFTEATSYCWDGAQLAEQYTDSTTLVWDYAGLRPLAQREIKTDTAQEEIDRRFFAIVTDLSGSPSELVDPDGALAWRARSTAWGITQWNRDSTAYTPLRYPGQYFDPETGLHYNVNRYYDPDLGRYITPDPLGLAPAINHYAYVPNPFTLADPLGLAGCDADPTWGRRVTFTRDEHGRPYEMNAIITRDMLDEGTHARNSLEPPGFLGGDYNQARGHMLARMLGGSGDTLDNLFTITQNPTNSPDMRDWEQDIYNAVADGEIITYNVYLEYTDDEKDSVPKYIQLEATGNRGFSLDVPMTNPAHEQQQRHRRGLL